MRPPPGHPMNMRAPGGSVTAVTGVIPVTNVTAVIAKGPLQDTSPRFGHNSGYRSPEEYEEIIRKQKAALLTYKSKYKQERADRLQERACRLAVQDTLGHVLQGMKDGEK